MAYVQCLLGLKIMFLTFAGLHADQNSELINRATFLSTSLAKIGITNFGSISHHSVRIRKQKTLNVFCFVICV
jgi:hypothetical protein